MRAVLLPNGNLLVPKPPDDLDEPEGSDLLGIGPDHPDPASTLPLVPCPTGW